MDGSEEEQQTAGKMLNVVYLRRELLIHPTAGYYLSYVVSLIADKYNV